MPNMVCSGIKRNIRPSYFNINYFVNKMAFLPLTILNNYNISYK